MSALRDARLKRALDSAPDAQLQPDARTRQAIHARAHAAIAPVTGRGWWRRLLGPDHHRMPWAAAFATVVMATLVTVLWHDREIPGARPDAVTAQAPVAAPQPQPQPQPQPVPAATPAPRVPSGVASAPAMRARPSAKPAPGGAPRQEGSTQAPPPIAAPARERGGERPTVKDEDAWALARSAPQQVESTPAAAETALAPPPAATAPAAARAPSAGLASPMRRSVAEDATRLRIVSPGRTLDAALEDRSRLADLLGRAAGMARSAEPLAGAPDMRVELRRQGEPAGVLELAGPQLRWTPPGGEGGGTARPDPALLQALREELERLAR